ncbi:MAG: oxygen-independent coproporphyrinogen III oxidase [Candidatus Competibacterales bacterium]
MILTTPLIDPPSMDKYAVNGPRYTSYPTANHFHPGFDAGAYRRAAEASNALDQATGQPRALSLYVHLRFCDTVCYYCACNRVITKNRARASAYLADLHREIEAQGALFDSRRPVNQLHWGGGTPTFISPGEMTALMACLGEYFALRHDDSGEYGIEVDPRAAGPDTVALLRSLGFNRLSVGIQDFDPAVQKAVNRIQSFAETAACIEAAKATGFHSVSVDLIYGLPHQSVSRFAATLDGVLSLEPDRLSVFNYAHLPGMFKIQRQIDPATLPTPAVKLELLRLVIERLTANGYIHIGMDHFAKPGDELAKAQAKGQLHRNFQGYSTHRDCDLVAVGASAIGKVGDTYSQNWRDVADYQRLVDQGKLPVMRGIALGPDDLLRRAVIEQLLCHFRLDPAALEAEYDIDFWAYFQGAMPTLEAMTADGLVSFAPDGTLTVEPPGRLLVRNIAMAFDGYLTPAVATSKRFSSVI